MKGRRWSIRKASEWYQKQPWLVGCNFIPSNAVNQLEMWQSETFDLVTIDRELGWASGLGFNLVRVYLHDLAYLQDPDGFLKRIDRFLDIANAHGIRALFVFFDDCWLVEPKTGKQPDPLPGIHNSGWLESPGLPQLERYSTDSGLRSRLENYIKSVLTRFREDKRILMWDLYNEPGGTWYLRGENGSPFKKGIVDSLCLPLLQDVYRWSRHVNPSQPLTSCWHSTYGVEAATQSADIISFHHYGGMADLDKLIQRLHEEAPGRPMICTEYLARSFGSKFQTHLPFFRKHQIGAINWGLVAGKTMTIYDWASWERPASLEEPKVWHHDIFRRDGSAFDMEEVALIRAITKEI